MSGITNTQVVVLGDARLPARFWQKVAASSSGCWLWTASLNNGYGVFAYTRRVRGHAA